MAVERFLGGAWATVHGPATPRQLLVWTLEAGFVGLVPAPGPRAFDWRQLPAARAQLPIKLEAVRVSALADPAHLNEAGLASGHAGEATAALAAITGAVELAVHLGCSQVILEPGVVPLGREGPVDLADEASLDDAALTAAVRQRDRNLEAALDRACRNLHRLTRRFPDLGFCLTTSRHVAGLGGAAGLEAIFEDLARSRLGYWHDTVAAACRQVRLGEAPGEFLENFSNRLSGITLGDIGGGTAYLPPGAGGVDYPLLSNYRRRSPRPLPAVVELDPGVAPEELPGIHAFLNKFGL